jgi:hypothetical protein
MSTITCSACEASRPSPLAQSGKPRIPRGWKEIAGKTYCQKCKLANFALRAVSLPVARCDWNTIMPLLRSAWRDCVRCSNWLLTQQYQADVIAVDNGDKLPLWKVPYLYPETRANFPEIEPTALVALINTVSAKYRASRFDLWRRKASLPVYRTMPIPVSAQAWELSRENDRWLFRFRWRGEWYTLTLRGGSQFHRQHRAFAEILNGNIEAGEAALYERGQQLMLKIAAWFPRGQAGTNQRAIKARTCAECFLIAVDGENIWRLNADHVRRWIVGADNQQQRLREDLKSERRFPREMSRGILDRMSNLSQKRNDRLSSWIHESSTQLVAWVKRRKASTLLWDDSSPSMLPSFPWYTFAARLSEKCEIAGIKFIHVSEGALDQIQPPSQDMQKSAK